MDLTPEQAKRGLEAGKIINTQDPRVEELRFTRKVHGVPAVEFCFPLDDGPPGPQEEPLPHGRNFGMPVKPQQPQPQAAEAPKEPLPYGHSFGMPKKVQPQQPQMPSNVTPIKPVLPALPPGFENDPNIRHLIGASRSAARGRSPRG